MQGEVNTDVVVMEPHTTDLMGPTVEDIDRAIEIYDKIRKAAQERLKEGVDYGVIPGTGNKPTLLQAGAEKLCNFFGLSIEQDTLERELDFPRKWASFSCRTILRSKKSGAIMASATSSINSFESKYIYQLFPERHPNVDKRDRNPAELADLLNTLEAMAQKRSLVKATKHATGLSDIYTQDVEDMPAGARSKGSTVQPDDIPGDVPDTVPFGKFKGKKWADLPDEYLEWMLNKPFHPDWAQKEVDRRSGKADQPEMELGETPMHSKQLEHLDTLFDKHYDSDFWKEFKELHPDSLTVTLYERFRALLEGGEEAGKIGEEIGAAMREMGIG